MLPLLLLALLHVAAAASYCYTSTGCSDGDCVCVPGLAQCVANACELTTVGVYAVVLLSVLGALLLLCCCCWLLCCCGRPRCCGGGGEPQHVVHYHPQPQQATGQPVQYTQHVEF